MITFEPYRKDFPSAAALELPAIARHTSTLSLAEQINAGFACESWLLGLIVPLSPNLPKMMAPAGTLTIEEAADLLAAHAQQGGNVAVALNWPAILAAIQALMQALKG